MFRQRESNPHFLPRHNDPIIEFPSLTHPPPPPPPRSKPPKPHRQGRTSVEPPYAPTPQPPHQSDPPPQPSQEFQPLASSGRSHHLAQHGGQTGGNHHHHPSQHGAQTGGNNPRHPSQHGSQTGGNHHHHHHHPSFLRAPANRQTRPIAWLIAAFCALFWVIIIVGGLIILIVYLVFRPRNPRFEISTATLNAAYLDMGYLLNADVTVLANFTNPNTKVTVDFSYVILDLYHDRNFIATRYIEPFSVVKGESRFADVHLMASQVRLSNEHSLELKKQMDGGRVEFEIRGLFRARSKLGGIFRYSYWLNAHCQMVVGGPPAGVLIGNKCVTKR
ncbi:hypothetical protein ABFS82_11G062700 [Erythranthe guttata]